MTTLRIDVPAGQSGDAPVVVPAPDAAQAMAPRYRQVPLAHTYLDDLETPVAAMLKLRGDLRKAAVLVASVLLLLFRPPPVQQSEHPLTCFI